MLLGRTNTATQTTVLSGDPRTGSGSLSLTSGGLSVAGGGTFGTSLSNPGFGVVARGRTGVLGRAYATGVFGDGGVTGVFGDGGVTGVFGNCHRGTGVVGSSQRGTGLSGSGRFGVVGRSQLSDGIGVRGQADTGASAKGVMGVSRDGFAGFFAGRVYATGSVTTEGTLSVAALHPDGTRRPLYSLASPLSYFQDFGRATLVRGRASVPLDPAFAALVQTDDYLVFLTPEARPHGLFVFSKTPTGFEVRDGDEDDDHARDDTDKNERPGVPFVWQVVARRRDTTGATARLEPLAAPAHVPELPPIPELPEVPPTPELPELPQATP